MIISEAHQGVILPRTVLREIQIPKELQENFNVGEVLTATVRILDGEAQIVIPERGEIPLPPSFGNGRGGVLSLQVTDRNGVKTLREIPAQTIEDRRALSEEFLRSLREVILQPGENEVALPAADSFEQLRDFLELVADKLTVLPEKSSKQLEETLRIIASLRKNSIFSVSLRDALEVNIQKLKESKGSEKSGALPTISRQVDLLTEGLRETIADVKKVSDGLEKLQLSSPKTIQLNRLSTAIQESIQKAVSALEEVTERVERLPESSRIVLLKTLAGAPESREKRPPPLPHDEGVVEMSTSLEVRAQEKRLLSTLPTPTKDPVPLKNLLSERSPRAVTAKNDERQPSGEEILMDRIPHQKVAGENTRPLPELSGARDESSAVRRREQPTHKSDPIKVDTTLTPKGLVTVERSSKDAESLPDALSSDVWTDMKATASGSDLRKIRLLRDLPATTVSADGGPTQELVESSSLKVVERALLQLKNLQKGQLREPLVKELELQIQKLPTQLRPERGVASPVTKTVIELIRKPRGELPVELRPAIHALSLTRAVNFNPDQIKGEQRVLELIQKQEQVLPKALSKMLVAVQREIRAILQDEQRDHPVGETVPTSSEPMLGRSEALSKATSLLQRESPIPTSRVPATPAQEGRSRDTGSKNGSPSKPLSTENEQSELVFAERFSKSIERSGTSSSFEKVAQDQSQKLEQRDTLSFLRASISGSDADLVKRLLTRLDDVRTERLRDLVQQLSKEFETPPPIEKVDESLFRLEQELFLLPKGVETPRTLRLLSTLTNALGVMLAAPEEEFQIKPPPWNLLLALQQSVEDTVTVLTTAERVQSLVNGVFEQGEKLLSPSAGFTPNEKALRLRELIDGLYSSLQKDLPQPSLRSGESFGWREFLKPRDETILHGLQKELRGVFSVDDTLQAVTKLKGERESTAPELTKILQMMKPAGESSGGGMAALSDARSLIDEVLSAKGELPIAVKEQYLRLRERVDEVLGALRPTVSKVVARLSNNETLPDEGIIQRARWERPSAEQSSERSIKRREQTLTVPEERRTDDPPQAQARPEREISRSAEQTERSLSPLTVPTTEATALLHRIDSFIRTQETLNSLNGVMHSMGEAAFILFPSVVNGLLTKFELSYAASEHLRPGRHPEESKLSEKSEQPSRGRNRKSHRVRFKIQLAALGEVEVDFIHELNSARIKLRTAEGEVTEFLNGELPALGDSLQGIGIRPVELRAEQGELHDVRPEWIRALLGTNKGL